MAALALGGVLIYPSPMKEALSIREVSVLHADTYRTVYEGPTIVALVAGTVALSNLLVVPLRPGNLEPSLDVPFLLIELLTAGLVVFVRWYEDRGLVPSVAAFDLPARLPVPSTSLSGGYASLALLTVVVPGVVGNSDQLFGVFNYYYAAGPKAQFGLPLGLLSAAVAGFVGWSLTVNRRFVYEQTLSGVAERGGWSASVVSIVVVLTTTVGLVLALHSYLSTFHAYLVAPLFNWNFYPFIDNAVASVILVGLLIPAVYFPLGAVVQSVQHVGSYVWLLIQSEPLPDAPTDSRVRLLPDDRICEEQPAELPDGVPRNAGSIHFGFGGVVLVDEGLWRHPELSSSELRAIVEHEVAHLDNGDALLLTIVPLAATAALVGQSVFLAALDFRTREFAADAAVSDPKALHDALGTLENSGGHSGLGPNLVPAVGVSQTARLYDRLFGLFFGKFAVERAHPSTEDRRERLCERAS